MCGGGASFLLSFGDPSHVCGEEAATTHHRTGSLSTTLRCRRTARLSVITAQLPFFLTTHIHKLTDAEAKKPGRNSTRLQVPILTPAPERRLARSARRVDHDLDFVAFS